MKQSRNRAWRRFKNNVHAQKVREYPAKSPQDAWVPPKNWKWLGRRCDKLLRAQQLGFEYPRLSLRRLIDKEVYPDEE